MSVCKALYSPCKPKDCEDGIWELKPVATMITIVAPSDLPANYQFQAVVGGHTIQVTVPAGGVTKGEKFQIPWDEARLTPLNPIPEGQWKDGICNCWDYGPFHNHWFMSLFCPFLALAQIMERLKYTPWAQSGGPSGKSTGLFRKARAVTISCCIIYYILYWSFIFSQQNTTIYVEDTPHGSDVPKGYALILFAALTLFITVVYVLLVVLVWNLRQHIRIKYNIPGWWCRDLRYALYCNPCAIAQMMRHTTDYDTYISKCCTATGVPKHATSIV